MYVKAIQCEYVVGGVRNAERDSPSSYIASPSSALAPNHLTFVSAVAIVAWSHLATTHTRHTRHVDLTSQRLQPVFRDSQDELSLVCCHVFRSASTSSCMNVAQRSTDVGDGTIAANCGVRG